MPIFLIFLIIPFVELFLFAVVSEHIGIWTTRALAFLTAIIGGALVKYQGLNTLLSMRQSTSNGEMPLNEIFDGFCIVAAGALLITPGFLTDFIGFALLVPSIRLGIKKALKSHGRYSFTEYNTASHSAYDDTVIDVEYEEIKEDHDKLR